MKNAVLTLALLILLSGRAAAEVRFAGGDGSTMAKAVQVLGAASDSAGVQAEYVWLNQHHPDLKSRKQSLLQDGDRLYDLLQLEGHGKTVEVYFDITDFFGKP